jgi:hypothetical protein
MATRERAQVLTPQFSVGDVVITNAPHKALDNRNKSTGVVALPLERDRITPGWKWVIVAVEVVPPGTIWYDVVAKGAPNMYRQRFKEGEIKCKV